MSTFRASPTVERGRDRLDNWGNWSRLDGSDTGLPRKCSYYTPPRAGDTWLESDDKDEESQPVINHLEAEWVEGLVLQMPARLRLAVVERYLHRREIFQIAKRLHVDRDKARLILVEAEAWVGRQ
jgi:DNA-directed RNA polymerase specialized sigma24 family protein